MRHVCITLIVLVAIAGAQTPADDQIEKEFESLMGLLRSPEGETLDEDAARARAAQFRGDLERFLSTWTPKEEGLARGHQALGRALTLAGRPKDAIPHFKAFVDRFPDDPDRDQTTVSLGTAYLDSGDLARAAEVLGGFLKERPDSDQRLVAEYYFAIVRYQQGSTDDALLRLDSVSRSGQELPVVADAAIKAIEILRDSGRVAEARQRLNSLLADNPEASYLQTLKEQLDWIGQEGPELVGMVAWVKGAPVTIAEAKGGVMVLNFFADRYESCIVELANLAKLENQFKDKPVRFVGVTKYYRPLTSVPAETQQADLEALLEKQGVTFPVGIAQDFRNLRAYGVRGVPHTVVIDKTGRIAHLKIGAGRDDDGGGAALARAIENALR
jgi:TolA-binding protein/peroxiredoxin